MFVTITWHSSVLWVYTIRSCHVILLDARAVATKVPYR